jgi:asparagine synthase (glutamine-hydrolysing)
VFVYLLLAYCVLLLLWLWLPAGRMEKYILRKAFDTPENPYLPAHVLWRQKEQFSDGVGYSWIDGLKEHANNVVSDQMLAAAQHR